MGGGQLDLDGECISATHMNEYAKMLGGNINILTLSRDDVLELSNVGRKVCRKLQQHPP